MNKIFLIKINKNAFKIWNEDAYLLDEIDFNFENKPVSDFIKYVDKYMQSKFNTPNTEYQIGIWISTKFDNAEFIRKIRTTPRFEVIDLNSLVTKKSSFLHCRSLTNHSLNFKLYNSNSELVLDNNIQTPALDPEVEILSRHIIKDIKSGNPHIEYINDTDIKEAIVDFINLNKEQIKQNSGGSVLINSTSYNFQINLYSINNEISNYEEAQKSFAYAVRRIYSNENISPNTTALLLFGDEITSKTFVDHLQEDFSEIIIPDAYEGESILASNFFQNRKRSPDITPVPPMDPPSGGEIIDPGSGPAPTPSPPPPPSPGPEPTSPRPASLPIWQIVIGLLVIIGTIWKLWGTISDDGEVVVNPPSDTVPAVVTVVHDSVVIPDFQIEATATRYSQGDGLLPGGLPFAAFSIGQHPELAQRIRLVGNPGDDPIPTFLANQRRLTPTSEGKPIFSSSSDFFAVTGAMFYEGDKLPPGLVLINGQITKPINRALEGEGNFYSPAPNGVVFVSATDMGIRTTSSVRDEQLAEYTFALQSGPMLVIGGNINTGFNPTSANKHLRCAVGVREKAGVKTLVFAASKEKVSFYELASFMKNDLGCENALHLESINSFMYFPGSDYKVDKQFIKNYLIIR